MVRPAKVGNGAVRLAMVRFGMMGFGLVGHGSLRRDKAW